MVKCEVHNHRRKWPIRGSTFTIQRLLARYSLLALRSSLLAPLFALACRPAYPPPPDTREATVVDTIRGVAIPDEYRWLEEQASAETRDWIDQQNAYAERIIGEPALRDALRARLRGLMDADDIGAPRRGGDWEYFTLRRSGQDLPVIYRRPAPPRDTQQRIDPGESYEMVLDPHSASSNQTTRFSIMAVSADGGKLIYGVRDGGQDENEVRVRDVSAGVDLPDVLPNALYSGVSWDADGTGFYYSHRSRQLGARVRHHVLGTSIEDDQELFGEGYGPESFVSMSQAVDGRFFVFTVQHGWASNEVHIQDNHAGSGIEPIVTGLDALSYPRIDDGTLYLRTNFEAPNYRVVAVDISHPTPAEWRDVIPEGEDVLQSYTEIDGKYYASYLHDVSSRIRIFEKDGTPSGEMAIPEHHTASIRGAGNGSAFLTLNGFATPPVTYLVDLGTGEREVWQSRDVDFDSTGVVVQQLWYQSNDGTRAPMYVVHREGVELDGSNPTLLYGYGGFNVSLTPRFDVMAAAWIEHGGVYAVATLRGGSEYGEDWHRDGMLDRKQNVFEDFTAAAEWLIQTGLTNNDLLAIRGVSNGVLLVASALTQRPELFRAVLCGFPDLDMVRFFTFTSNNNLPALREYGDASKPDHFDFLRAYSPYQKVSNGVDYPAVMLTSGDLDTRVPPLQARKMTARLQNATSSGLSVILRYDPKAGHAAGRGRPFSKAVEDTAAELTFLLAQLGLHPGQSYGNSE